MPQFFFRDRLHAAAQDGTPYELTGLAEALAEANHRARRLVSRGRMRGETLKGGLDVENADHMVVARVLFADVSSQLA